MLELWKEVLDKGKSVGAIFMGLSKAFDTLNHDLLLENLELTDSLLITFKVTYAIVYEEQMWTIISVYGKIFLLVFHKDLYYAPYTLTTYFFFIIMYV